MHPICEIKENLRHHKPLPKRLTSAYQGFEAIEHSIRGLLTLAREQPIPTYKNVLFQAVLARAELAKAPAFPWPLNIPPPRPAVALADDRTVLQELAHLAEDITFALVEASAQTTEVNDHRACTVGAVHACLIQQGLHRAAETLTAEKPHRTR
ncbi:hypothetical protein [Thermomonospora cellulosilytica]|uniref:Uncharacterized protein n=1 Tax=Thermomonospora cellulosilytica TaxID=1411118 RepID=A0A7W3N4H0_9ACTN|nr:hypothetical protein [Thermomonospora cellulosilytica]MBA9007297.1 hypothetical protein [Thermomonospora cellulosilytica]